MAKGKRYVVVVEKGKGKDAPLRWFISDESKTVEDAANEYVARSPRNDTYTYSRRQYEEN